MAQTTHDRDQRRNALRSHYQALTDEALADRLFRIADEPRRWDPDEKFALLYTAAARLRQRSQEARA